MSGAGAAFEAGMKIAEALTPTAEEQRQQRLEQQEIQARKEREELLEEFMRGGTSTDLQQVQEVTGRDQELTVYQAKSQAMASVDSARALIEQQMSSTAFSEAIFGGVETANITGVADAATAQAINDTVTNFAGVDAHGLAADLRMDAFNRIQGQVASVAIEAEQQAPEIDPDLIDPQDDLIEPLEELALSPEEVLPTDQLNEPLAVELEPELQQHTPIDARDILQDPLATPQAPEAEAAAIEVESRGPVARPENDEFTENTPGRRPIAPEDLL